MSLDVTTRSSVPLLRWDNKEEFRHLETYSHHHRDVDGRVHPSPLTGEPVRDVGGLPELLAISPKVWVDYDAEADVLYISFRKPQRATESELEGYANSMHE